MRIRGLGYRGARGARACFSLYPGIEVFTRQRVWTTSVCVPRCPGKAGLVHGPLRGAVPRGLKMVSNGAGQLPRYEHRGARAFLQVIRKRLERTGVMGSPTHGAPHGMLGRSSASSAPRSRPFSGI
jgi:hypothetical protein